DGASVQAGEPLLELETDKATNVVPAPGSGVLKIGAAEGQTVAIGATVGTIDPAGTPAPAASGTAPDRPNGQEKRPSEPAPAPTPAPAPEPAPTSEAPAGTPDDRGADRPLAPSVRRLVAEQDVDVAQVAGTGPGGRVTKGDVLAFLGSTSPAPATPATRPATPWPKPHE